MENKFDKYDKKYLIKKTMYSCDIAKINISAEKHETSNGRHNWPILLRHFWHSLKVCKCWHNPGPAFFGLAFSATSFTGGFRKDAAHLCSHASFSDQLLLQPAVVEGGTDANCHLGDESFSNNEVICLLIPVTCLQCAGLQTNIFWTTVTGSSKKQLSPTCSSLGYIDSSLWVFNLTHNTVIRFILCRWVKLT